MLSSLKTAARLRPPLLHSPLCFCHWSLSRRLPQFNKQPGELRKSAPRNLWKGSEQGLIHPPLLLFSIPSFLTWSLGSFNVSVSYFPSSDEFFITRAEMTRGNKRQDQLIFQKKRPRWIDIGAERSVQMWATKSVCFVPFFFPLPLARTET